MQQICEMAKYDHYIDRLLVCSGKDISDDKWERVFLMS
jgi:hypothetical protein